jgi:hypothetical protein
VLLLPHELIEKYPALPQDVIYAAMEIATIRAVTQIYRRPAGATINPEEGIHVFLFKNEGIESVDISKLRKRSKRRLLDEIEIELMRQQAIREATSIKSLRGSIVTGRIERITQFNMDVLIEITDVLQPILINAECPIEQQPRHERGCYSLGESRPFFVASCLPVSNGKAAKVRVVVSRMAREFPSRLLGKLTGINGIKCLKRVPGGYCKITTPGFIPKTAINTVGKELREIIDVIKA